MATGEGPRRIGAWILQDKLGEGGNATVWLAAHQQTGEKVALKVIHASKASKEPYLRFVREIETLTALGNRSGILPLIDAYLPEMPGPDDRAWLAMPVAAPMDRALKGAGLDVVVAALAQIAETLALLAAEKGLAHRDIKPGNLYHLAGQWLIGDFGLVALPDVPELTRSGRPLGPAHYTPYEMIIDPVRADPHAADVYSLGKTLWVLASEQSFPPEGHQPATTRRFSIADLRPHPHSGALDRLVDLMTRLHPEERPAKDQVARDLRAWEELSKQTVQIDVSEIRSRLRIKMTRELADEDQSLERKEHAFAAVRRLQELTKPLNDALASVHPRPEIDAMDDKLTENIARTSETMGSAQIVFRWQRCSRIGAGPSHSRYQLRMGRSLELTGRGDLILRTLIDVGHAEFSGHDFWWLSSERTAPVGSIEAERMLEDGVGELKEQLILGLEAFAANVPSPESG